MHDTGDKTEKFLSHQERIDILYAFQVHKVSMQDIALSFNRSYSSIKAVVKAYLNYGHTNRLRNFW